MKVWSRNKIIFIIACMIVIVWVVYSVSKPSNPSTTLTTSVQLKSSDFLIVSESQICGTSVRTATPSLLMGFNLGNRMNLPFHFVSAQVVLINFTLSNGTVVSVNGQVVDNKESFDTQHLISVEFNEPSLPAGVRVTDAEFVITAQAQEVSDRIVLPLSEPIQPCST